MVTRTIATGALVAAALTLTTPGTTWAATAPTANSTGAYGNPTRYAPYQYLQATSDCVEQSALMAMSAIRGSWAASHAGIDTEATKLGILYPNDQGSTFDATNVSLFAHYGFKATTPKPTSRTTLMAALSAGDSAVATVYAGDLWNGMPDPLAPGYVEYDPNTAVSPDHAVTIEAINKTTHAVTVGDTGIGFTYTVPWAQFSKAWSVGDYNTMIIKKG